MYSNNVLYYDSGSFFFFDKLGEVIVKQLGYSVRFLIGQKPMGYWTSKVQENCYFLQLFYKNDKPHFLWVFRRVN